MKKLSIIIITFFVWQCQSNNAQKISKAVYIYDSNRSLELSHNSNDSIQYSSFSTVKPVYTYVDTFLVAKNYKYYSLWHYSKYNNRKDTFFVKHKSYLDSIEYYNQNWLADEEKLDSFWKPVQCWKCSGNYDSLEICLILPKENIDSVIVQQVHRWFHQTQ